MVKHILYIFFLFVIHKSVYCTKPRLNLPPLNLKVCKICKASFDPAKNSEKSCRFHSGRWMGAENSKHLGTRSGGKNVGLSLFWDCCDQEKYDGLGCQFGKHLSYDD